MDTNSSIYKYFSRQECLRGRDSEYPLSPEMEKNLVELLHRLNKFREAYGKPMYINSLYRPGKYNEAAGGAKNSDHLDCRACDFKDIDRNLAAYILAHPRILEECDLYQEDPNYTKTWIHLSIRRPGSGNRVFKP